MMSRMRTWSLWAAYIIMVFGFFIATQRLDARMGQIEDDICFAVVTDLKADLLNPNLSPQDQEALAALTQEIEESCG